MNARSRAHLDRRSAGAAEPVQPAAANGAVSSGIILSLIVVCALTVRLVYLHQIETIPFFHDLVSDAEVYNNWAATIAAGHWWGDEVFYQAPLYPYFLASIKLVVGDSLLAPRVVQIVLGSLSCGLIGLAGWALLSRRAGLWAAGLLALYPPAIFFDGLIQKTSLAQFLTCAMLALIGWTQKRSNLLELLALGVVLGLFCLARENAIALVPVLALWAGFCGRGGERIARVGRAVLLLAGVAVVLVPVGLRNLSVGGEFLLTTSQMGPNFYIGNNPDATGRYRPLVKGHETPQFERSDATAGAREALGREPSPSEVSDYWMRRAWDYIRDRPSHWVKLLGYKWLLVWNFYEIPDSESFYVYSDWSWMLGFLTSPLEIGRVRIGMHFGVLVPLAAAGVVLTWSKRRVVWVLYAALLVTAAAVAVFYVFARYRYPLVPLCALFAGGALARGIGELRRVRWPTWLATVALALPVAVVVNLPINPRDQLDSVAWGNMGSALARQGKYPAAALFFERAVRGAPASPEMHYNLGLAYTHLRRYAQAVQHLEHTVRIAPRLSAAHYQLGVAKELLGDRRAAVTHYLRALELAPDDADARDGLRRLRE